MSEIIGQRDCADCDGEFRDPVTGMLCMFCKGTGVIDEYASDDEDDYPDEDWHIA